jgi:DNA mismatch endonuclease (patch repair protein)
MVVERNVLSPLSFAVGESMGQTRGERSARPLMDGASIAAFADLIMAGRTTPSFTGLRPASAKASGAARGSSTKSDTKCEIMLRRELRRRGLRYRLHPKDLPGRPDIVLRREQIAIFCDGDFWHGRNLAARVAALSRGHNAEYWIAKVKRNVHRDGLQTRALESLGWTVVRLWETDILRSPPDAAQEVVKVVRQRGARRAVVRT